MIVKAPAPWPHGQRSVFLAGSIEMGTAVDWQAAVTKALLAARPDLLVLNPRRDDWDASWVQAIDNSQFFEQVSWELAAMEQRSRCSSWVCMPGASPAGSSSVVRRATGARVTSTSYAPATA